MLPAPRSPHRGARVPGHRSLGRLDFGLRTPQGDRVGSVIGVRSLDRPPFGSSCSERHGRRVPLVDRRSKFGCWSRFGDRSAPSIGRRTADHRRVGRLGPASDRGSDFGVPGRRAARFDALQCLRGSTAGPLELSRRCGRSVVARRLPRPRNDGPAIPGSPALGRLSVLGFSASDPPDLQRSTPLRRSNSRSPTS